jgi:hypothetical protein
MSKIDILIKKNNRSFFKLMLIAFAVSIFFLFKNLLFGLHESFNTALIFLGCCIFIPLLIKVKKKNFFLFDPSIIIPLWFGLMYYFTSIPLYSFDKPTNYFASVLFSPLNKDNVVVIYTLSFGILLFYLGYGLVNKIILNKGFKMNRSINVQSFLGFKKYFLVLYLFSILFRFYGYSTGFMGSLTNMNSVKLPSIPFISVLFFITNSWVVYFFFFSALSHSSKKNRNTFLIFLFLEVFFMLVSGDRRNLIILFFTYFVSFYMIHKYVPIIKIIKIGVPFVVVVLPIITVFGFLLPTIDNFQLTTVLGLFEAVFHRLGGLTFSEITDDFVINPLIQSFGYLSNVGIAYSQFTLQGIEWGAVGVENLLSKLIPSVIYPSSFNERVYYEMFASKAITYNVEYSFLTFTAQSEQMLSFGIVGVLGGMFLQGVIACTLFRMFNSINTPVILRIIFLGLLFRFTINFLSGLLVSDLVTGFRILFYACIFYVFYKMLISK